MNGSWGDSWGGSWGDSWGGSWGAVDVAAPSGGARFTVPRDLLDAQRLGIVEADDLLLMVCGAVAAGLLSG